MNFYKTLHNLCFMLQKCHLFHTFVFSVEIICFFYKPCNKYIYQAGYLKGSLLLMTLRTIKT